MYLIMESLNSVDFSTFKTCAQKKLKYNLFLYFLLFRIYLILSKSTEKNSTIIYRTFHKTLPRADRCICKPDFGKVL